MENSAEEKSTLRDRLKINASLVVRSMVTPPLSPEDMRRIEYEEQQRRLSDARELATPGDEVYLDALGNIVTARVMKETPHTGETPIIQPIPDEILPAELPTTRQKGSSGS